MSNSYDVVIIGSGPAGSTAALFLARAGLKAIVFEENTLGGAIVNVELIENYPSYPHGISGSELSTNLVNQVMQHGVEFKLDTVTGVDLLPEGLKSVKTEDGNYLAKAMIIAAGAAHKRLGIPGEDTFEGNGLSYCAYCDGTKFTDKEVVVIGGGDSGVTEALYMSRIAAKVTLIELLSKLSASRVLQKRAEDNPKVEIVCSTKVEEITAEGELRNLRLKNVESAGGSFLRASGIFVRIGIVPHVDYFKDIVELDEFGFVVVNQNMETNVPGIFAAGDIRTGSPRQWVTAAGDGAVAAISAERYITLL